MNEILTYEVLQALIDCHVTEFVICAGSRNVSFVEALARDERLTTYFHPEERSASFFALGRSRLLQQPVAIITTSGSASAELLPAAMEAYYSGVPLILVTADRPRIFRGTGAPQAAEQEGLFGRYARFSLDISGGEAFSLALWDQRGPMHLNVCLEEPQSQPSFKGRVLSLEKKREKSAAPLNLQQDNEILNRFFQQVERPLAIVSTLHTGEQEAVAQFLAKLNCPLLLEGVSGLREDARLQPFAVHCTEQVLQNAKAMGYEIDGVLRIGGVPTHRVWRDLEYQREQIKVCSLTPLPFSGLSWSRCVIEAQVSQFITQYQLHKKYNFSAAQAWLETEKQYYNEVKALFEEEPYAEPTLVHALSGLIPARSFVYLGNSLPIREWDLAAVKEQKWLNVRASRGVNGIDGQLSTFLGQLVPGRENWAIIGDLTALYDMAGFWIYSQLPSTHMSVALINNGGGQIFSRIFKYKQMLNEHSLSFEPLAKMWSLAYQRFDQTPLQFSVRGPGLFEIVPDPAATSRFWKKFSSLSCFKERFSVA